MNYKAVILVLVTTLACADVVSYVPAQVVSFGVNGAFNSNMYLTLDKGYDLVMIDTGVCLVMPCAPDVVQVFTKTGTRIADVALKPTDNWSKVTLMLPVGAYQIHVTGPGVGTQLQISNSVSK